MLPKKSKDHIKPVAEKLNLDANLVSDAVAFYYKTLRKALSHLDHYNIMVENLGTFKIKERSIPKIVIKYTEQLSYLKSDTFQQMSIRKDIEVKLERILNLQENIKEEKQRKKEFIKTKQNGNTGKDLES